MQQVGAGWIRWDLVKTAWIMHAAQGGKRQLSQNVR
jgi:hypothetical protein